MDDAIGEIARISPALDRSSILQPDADGRFDLSIVLIPGFALGDLARVVDTLTTANSIAGKPLFHLQTVGLTRGPVPSPSSIDVNPARCLADAAKLLEARGKADESSRLLRELVSQYPETRDAEEAKARLK